MAGNSCSTGSFHNNTATTVKTNAQTTRKPATLGNMTLVSITPTQKSILSEIT